MVAHERFLPVLWSSRDFSLVFCHTRIIPFVTISRSCLRTGSVTLSIADLSLYSLTIKNFVFMIGCVLLVYPPANLFLRKLLSFPFFKNPIVVSSTSFSYSS